MANRVHVCTHSRIHFATAGTFDEVNRAIKYHELILALGERWFSQRISYATYMRKHRRLLARMQRYGITQLR